MPGIPDFEKMTLNFNHDTGVLYQEVGEGELELLEKAYEIGCGTGYLLYELKKLGANVVGIEPGPYARVGKEKYNFTKQTLQNTVAMYTNLGVDMEESSFAGALYAKASYSAVTKVNLIEQERKKVLGFADKIKYYQDKLQNLN